MHLSIYRTIFYTCVVDMSIIEEIQISYADSSDVPKLTQVHLDGFELDGAIRLTYTSAERKKILKRMLETQISSPEVLFTKATKQSTNDILGWQRCTLFGYHNVEEEKASIKVEGLEQKPTIEELIENALPKDSPRRKLYELTHEDAAQTRKAWMGDKKYIYLNTLVVNPHHQGHGVGSALIRWATAKADADGVPCWLNSSPVAYPLYVKAGFKEVGFKDVDLREFAPKDAESERQHGIYHCAYMLREPQGRPGNACLGA